MNRLLGTLNIPGLAAVAGCMALWELYSRTLGAQYETIASATQTFKALLDLLAQGKLQNQFLHTLSVSVVGWLTATVLGLAMGMAIGWSRLVWTYTMATIDVLRSIPSISLVSVALLMFGFSSSMELVIVVYVSQWPVLLATAGGLRSTPDNLLDVAHTLRLSPAALIFKILFPAALPKILVGIRLSLTLSIALAVVAEMVGNPAGLGFGLVFAQQAIQPAQAFAYLFVIGLLGWGANAILVRLVQYIFKAYEGLD